MTSLNKLKCGGCEVLDFSICHVAHLMFDDQKEASYLWNYYFARNRVYFDDNIVDKLMKIFPARSNLYEAF